MKKSLACLALIGIFIALLFSKLTSAYAVPFNGTGGFSLPTTIIDFESFAQGTAQPSNTDLSISAEFPGAPAGSQASGVVVRSQGFTQFPNIFEGQYYGFAAANYFIQFNGTVQEFGMGVFDPNFTGNVLVAYDILGNELERVTSDVDPEFPTGSPGGNFSTFVGFSRATADINRIELLVSGNDVLGIDTVTYSPLQAASSVPEPTTGIVFLSSLIGFQYVRRRNRAAIKSSRL
ncbi:MAG: PEP-CTERM sorting domain-containing protein [Alphaproteobacteria bacterium]|nr:PEP-CTERM sorting domain-containing protein [Alphaproteobacteria bacterium]